MRVAALLVLLPLLAACHAATNLPGRRPDPRGPLVPADPTAPQEEHAPYLVGRVTDLDGWPLPGISVREKDRHHGTRTDSYGRYVLRLAGLPPGRIVRVIAEANGYQPAEVPVPVRPGPNQLDLVLSPVEPAQAKVAASDTALCPQSLRSLRR